MKALSSPLKAKSTMDESLHFSFSWESFVYNVEETDVEIDLARFLIYVI